MDKFEKIIKDSVEGYEAPYSADAWQSLNKAMGPSKAVILKWIAGSAAVIALIAVGYNLMSTNNTVAHSSTNQNNNANTSEQSNVKHTTTNNIASNTVESNNSTSISNSKTNNLNNTNSVIDNVGTTDIDGSPSNTNNTLDITTIEIDEVDNITPLDYIGDELVIDESDMVPQHNKAFYRPLYIAKVIVDNTTKCKSESFEFTPSVPKQKAIYEWNLGDGTIKTGGYINHKYESAGNYTVTLTLKDTKTNKVVKQSEGIDVNVLSVPQSDFSFEHSNGILPNTIFKANSKPQTNIQWEIVGLESNNRNEFNYSFKRKGDYVVKLTTTAENGCSTTARQVISIKKDYNLLAPTAFSPNGDYLNDEFIPKALPLLNLPFTMTIYDRQGKMVYQTTDANSPWDGLYTKDGISAPNGVYIWIVQLTNENGAIEQYQDQITIAR